MFEEHREDLLSGLHSKVLAPLPGRTAVNRMRMFYPERASRTTDPGDGPERRQQSPKPEWSVRESCHFAVGNPDWVSFPQRF